LFKILDPDPQYFQKDHFQENKNESHLMFLECIVAVVLWLYCIGAEEMSKCLWQVWKEVEPAPLAPLVARGAGRDHNHISH
jgi:hypothetical protein